MDMQHGTLFDYASWRGDISFEQSGFNDADNLVFSFLTYADFQNVKVSEKENKDGLTVREYYERLVKSGGFPKDLDLLIHLDEFELLAKTARFGNVLIRNYVDIVKDGGDSATQFSAMEFCFGNNEHYIGFRGTDDSVAGWREDCSFFYEKAPCQEMAREYLEEHIVPDGTYYVGGHSKGGNLAIYGSAKLSEEKYKWVKKIYTNDAPGICKEVMDPGFLKRIDSKTVRIIPTYAVIGMLFPYPFTDTRIVRSQEKGLMQHNIKSWLVSSTELYTAGKLNEECVAIDEALSTYLEDTEFQSRKKIVDDLFDAFDDSGKKKTVSSIRNGGMKELQRVLVSLAKKNPETKKAVTRLPFTVWFGKTLMVLRHVKPVEFLVNYPSIPLGAVLVIFGLLLVFVPFASFPYLIGGLFVAFTAVETVILFYLLYVSRWNWKTNMTRIYLNVILVALSVSYFVSPATMAGFSCIIFGILMMALSFTLVNRMIDLYYKNNGLSFAMALIQCLSMQTVGIYFIIVNDYSAEVFATVAGWIFVGLGAFRVLDGVSELIRNHIKSKQE